MKPIVANDGVGASGNAHQTASARWALASLSLSMLMPSLDTGIANAGLPSLAMAFDASFQAVQWIVLAYLLAMTSLLVGVGRFGDLIGHRRLLLAGILVFTGASVLCGLAPGLGFLVVARGVQGLGAAVMIALTLACVGKTVPKEKTGSTMGLLGTMSAVGTTLGPSFGGMMTVGLGWRAIFLVNIPLGILNFLLARRFLPVDRAVPKHERTGFDITGMLVLSLTLAAYALALTVNRGEFGSLNLAFLASAILGTGIFVRTEATAAFPLIRLEMFRNPVLSASLAMSVLVSTVMMATLVVGPFYLTGSLGLEIAQSGIVLSVGPLVAALTGVPGGRIVDRFGVQRMTLAGLLAIATGCLVLSRIPAIWGIAGYLPPIACVTAGYALFQAANNTSVMNNLRPEHRGVISGMIALSRNLGLITGASFMGAVFALASAKKDGTMARPEAIAEGMHVTYGVAGFLVLIAIAITSLKFSKDSSSHLFVNSQNRKDISAR